MGTASSRRIKKNERSGLKSTIERYANYGRNPSSMPGFGPQGVHNARLLYDLQVSSLPRAKRVMLAAKDRIQERYPDEPIDDAFPKFAYLDFTIRHEDGALYHIYGSIEVHDNLYIPPHSGGEATDEADGYEAMRSWVKLADAQRQMTGTCYGKVKKVVEEASTYRQLHGCFKNMSPLFPSDVIDDLRSALRSSRLPPSGAELSHKEREHCEAWLAKMRLLSEQGFYQCPVRTNMVSGPYPAEPITPGVGSALSLDNLPE
jgi:hypothetical protein